MKKKFFIKKLDYLANTYPPSKSKYPDGSDIEIFKFSSLKTIFKMAKKKEEKEHVTHLFWQNPKKFKIKTTNRKKNISKYKFSVDHKHDLLLIRKIIHKIKENKKHGTAEEIVNFINKDKKLKKISDISRYKYIKYRKDLINYHI